MQMNIFCYKGIIRSLFILILLSWGSLCYAQPGAPVLIKDKHIETPQGGEVIQQDVADTRTISSFADEYVVGPDDQITIRVYGEEDLTGVYIVSTSGDLSIPLIGDVHVKDLTLSEIKALITAKLKDGYLLDPQISMEISKYRPFYILGEVNVPGSYDYVSNMNVLNAVAVAGGFTYRANKKTIEIMRTRDTVTEVIESRSDEFEIIPGDIIFVKERFF